MKCICKKSISRKKQKQKKNESKDENQTKNLIITKKIAEICMWFLDRKLMKKNQNFFYSF